MPWGFLSCFRPAPKDTQASLATASNNEEPPRAEQGGHIQEERLPPALSGVPALTEISEGTHRDSLENERPPLVQLVPQHDVPPTVSKSSRRVSTVFDPTSLTFKSLATFSELESFERGKLSQSGAPLSAFIGDGLAGSNSQPELPHSGLGPETRQASRETTRLVDPDDVRFSVELGAGNADERNNAKRARRSRRVSIVAPNLLDKLLLSASVNSIEDPVSILTLQSVTAALSDVREPVVVVKLVPKRTEAARPSLSRPSLAQQRDSRGSFITRVLSIISDCPASDVQAVLAETVTEAQSTHGMEVVFVNQSAEELFDIDTSEQFVGVLQELLSYDPQMSVVLQDAMNSLLQGEPSSVVHIMPQLQDQTFSCLSMTLRPCAFQDEGESIRAALFLVFGVDKKQTAAPTRMMRDYKLLSKVPGTITLFDSEGSVLHQNAASIKYMGNMMGRNKPSSKGISDPDNKLHQLFRHTPQKLEELLEELRHGHDWTGVVRVPCSLATNDDGGGVGGPRKTLNSEALAHIVKSVMASDFESCFSNQHARVGTPTARANRSQDTTGYFDVTSRMSTGGIDYSTQASTSLTTREMDTVDTHHSSGIYSSSVPSSPMHYLPIGNPTQTSPLPHVHLPRDVDKIAAEDGDENTEIPAQSESDVLFARISGKDYVWHEIHATSFSDPVTKQEVLLVVQLDVTAKVEAEKQLADLTEAQLRWLSMLFPRHVIEHMTQKGGLNLKKTTEAAALGQYRNLATRHEAVTILFADIVGFTSMSKDVPATSVMDFLNVLYTQFDALLDVHNVYKVETVGDCYVVAGGLVTKDLQGFSCVTSKHGLRDEDHAVHVVEFAKDMVAKARQVKMPHNDNPVQLRIGIHTGPIVSGVVGLRMPRFCLFGDTMNTASRMETTCRPGYIHMSEATRDLLPTRADLIATGGVDVKGKGFMETYLLLPPNHKPYTTFENEVDDAFHISGSFAPHSLEPLSTQGPTSFMGPVGLH